MSDPIIDMYEIRSKKVREGTLTIREAGCGFFRIREGCYANRVIIIPLAEKIDGKRVCFFANELTWIYLDDIAEFLCEPVSAIFSECTHKIDYTKSTWYGDGGDGPYHHEW